MFKLKQLFCCLSISSNYQINTQWVLVTRLILTVLLILVLVASTPDPFLVANVVGWRKLNFDSDLGRNLDSLISTRTKELLGLVFRNKGRGLVNSFYRMILPVHLGPKETIQSIVRMSRLIYHLSTHGGVKYCVLYLKASQVLVMQSLGNHVLHDVGLLGLRVRRARSGLPYFIPVVHRRKMMKGEVKYIQFWMTLLGFFRVMSFVGVVNLSTITEVGKSINFYRLSSLRKYIRDIFMGDKGVLVRHTRLPFKTVFDGPLGKASMYFIGKSGPQVYFDWAVVNSEKDKPTFVNSSLISLFRSAYALRVHTPDVYEALKEWMIGVLWSPRMRDLFVEFSTFQVIPDSPDRTETGRLGLKEEAAGKIRVFAFVDA